MTSKLIYGYWNTRGRGQTIRFLLEYVEADYTEKIYHFTNPNEWFEQDKKVLKPFPNLPYIQDGDFYISEHDTVIKYIVKKHPKYHELLGIGKNNNDEFVVDQLVNVINDLRQVIRDLYLNPNVDQVKDKVLNSTQSKFNQLIEFKSENNYLLPYLTIADFKLVEVLLTYKGLDEQLFAKNLQIFDNYINQFYNLPKINQYCKTDRYKSHNEFFPNQKAVKTGAEFLESFNKQFI